MNDLMVLVVTHKEFDDSVLPSAYQVVKVGNILDDTLCEQRGWLSDHIGDNISQENPYYCELTAQYWGWHNLPQAVIYTGISHYRRYFFDYKRKSTQFYEDILDEAGIRRILSQYKAIMPYPTVKHPGGGDCFGMWTRHSRTNIG